MMQREEFLHVLFGAATFLKAPLGSVAAQSLKDAYGATKAYFVRKLGLGSAAHRTLEAELQHPESPAAPRELTANADWKMDDVLSHLGSTLAAHLRIAASPAVSVSGHGHHVQVAGRDLVTTVRHVRRSVITPDERHIRFEQRKELAALIAQLADRLAGEDGQPRSGAVHAMLQQRFGIMSYLLLPAGQFEAAAAFLRQQGAIHRTRLRRRNPAAYRLNFLRAIHARRLALGWLKPQLYAFATEKLALRTPLTSLHHLGPIQLKSLAEMLRRAVASHTSRADA